MSTLIEILLWVVSYIYYLLLLQDTIFNGVRAKLAERRKINEIIVTGVVKVN